MMIEIVVARDALQPAEVTEKDMAMEEDDQDEVVSVASSVEEVVSVAFSDEQVGSEVCSISSTEARPLFHGQDFRGRGAPNFPD